MHKFKSLFFCAISILVLGLSTPTIAVPVNIDLNDGTTPSPTVFILTGIDIPSTTAAGGGLFSFEVNFVDGLSGQQQQLTLSKSGVNLPVLAAWDFFGPAPSTTAAVAGVPPATFEFFGLTGDLLPTNPYVSNANGACGAFASGSVCNTRNNGILDGLTNTEISFTGMKVSFDLPDPYPAMTFDQTQIIFNGLTSISTVTVPEPGVLWLFAFGLLGAGFTRRRFES